MRRIYIILFLCLLLTCETCVTTANAAVTSMETVAVSADEKVAILESINLQVIQETNVKQSIYCFDVSQNGSVVLGLGSTIYVYNVDGEFQYGFSFHRDGAYGIEFQGDLLTIFFLRGNVLATFDSMGNCVDVQKVVSSERDYIAIKELLNRTEKEIGGKQYLLERDLEIGDSYARLIMTDEVGKTTVLYDASSQHSIEQAALIVFVIGFFSMVIRGCIQKLTKGRHHA